MTDFRYGTNPETDTNGTYRSLFSAMSMFRRFIDSCTDVVVTAVSEDKKTVDVKLVAGERMENGEDLPQVEYKGLPIVQMSGSSGKIRFKVNVGDIGVIIARKFDIDMPENSGEPVGRRQVLSGRIMSFVQGFFVPISFCGSSEVDFELISGTSSVKMNEGDIEIMVEGNAKIKSQNAVIEAQSISLGGEEGARGLALQGMKVTNNGQPNGATVGFIAEGSLISKSL